MLPDGFRHTGGYQRIFSRRRKGSHRNRRHKEKRCKRRTLKPLSGKFQYPKTFHQHPIPQKGNHAAKQGNGNRSRQKPEIPDNF